MTRFAFLALLLAGCAAPPPEPSPPPTGPPIDYAGWPALTDGPVRVPDGAFADCRAWTERDSENTNRGPHFAPAVRYFVNPEGRDAVAGGTGPVPVGTTVVKEKWWNEAGPLTAIAAMVKREAGYDPRFGDWEYVYARQENGTWTTERGKLDNCRSCHHAQKDTDFLFRTYRKK